MRLRPHQAQAVRRSVRYFDEQGDGARGILHMACASGKTFTALRIAEALDGSVVMVCLPTLALVAQCLQAWTKDRRIPFRSICVCSDETVAHGLPDRAADHGIEATTDPDAVVTFLREAPEATETWSVIFCTYQSVAVVSVAIRDLDVEIDLVVCDEAHRTATGGKKGEGQFKLVLDDEIVPARRRLFLTATPRVYHKRVRMRALSVGYEIASMDDLAVYGPVIYRFSFAEAIKRRILADYRVVVMGVRSKAIRELIRSRTYVDSLGEAVDAATIATHLALAKAVQRFGLKKIVVYHPRVDDAIKFSDPTSPYSFRHTVRSAGVLKGREIWTAAVHSNIRVSKRLRVLEELTIADDRVSIVSNARCLTEGVNVPSLDAVMFTHPKRSVVDIVQAVGRALRVPEGWEPAHEDDHPPFGHVIIPVIVDDESPDASIDASDYDTVATILRRIRSMDAELGEMIDSYAVSGGERVPSDPQAPTFQEKVQVILPDGLHVQDLVSKVRAKVVELSSDFWQTHYNALREWTEAHGHARPVTGGSLQSTVYKGFKIGDWVSRQRIQYQKGHMSHVRATLFEELPGWSWDPRQDRWDQWLLELTAYYAGEIVRPPHLNRWISRVRDRYAAGTLGQDRVTQLEAIEGWKWVATGVGARGRRKVRQIPNEDTLLRELEETGSFVALGKRYSVSDNAVRKWLLGYGWTRPRLRLLAKRLREAGRSRAAAEVKA